MFWCFVFDLIVIPKFSVVVLLNLDVAGLLKGGNDADDAKVMNLGDGDDRNDGSDDIFLNSDVAGLLKGGNDGDEDEVVNLDDDDGDDGSDDMFLNLDVAGLLKGGNDGDEDEEMNLGDDDDDEDVPRRSCSRSPASRKRKSSDSAADEKDTPSPRKKVSAILVS